MEPPLTVHILNRPTKNIQHDFEQGVQVRFGATQLADGFIGGMRFGQQLQVALQDAYGVAAEEAVPNAVDDLRQEVHDIQDRVFG